jgi:hypothetical protein
MKRYSYSHTHIHRLWLYTRRPIQEYQSLSSITRLALFMELVWQRKYELLKVIFILLRFGVENTEKKTPIISLSGNSIKKQKKDFENLDISCFLRKPISRVNLEAAIKQIFNT